MARMRAMIKQGRALAYARGLRLRKPDGYERLVAGVFGTPDRIPLVAHPYTYAMDMHALTARTFFTQPRPFVHACSNFARYFAIDFWSPSFDFCNIELEALGQKLIWSERGEPRVDASHPLLASEGDLSRLRPPRPGKDARMPFVLESYRRYLDLVGIPPVAHACSPFSMAALARGHASFLQDMRGNPAFAHRLMEFLSMEVVVPWIERMAEVSGASLVVMCDPWASHPGVTADLTREFCLPYIEKVVRATGSPLRTVTDTGSRGERAAGNPREALDLKMEMAAAGNRLKSLRPLFLLVWDEDYEEVGIPLVKGYAEERKVCLLLNLRPELIASGPPEAIVEGVRGLVREGAGEGRSALLIDRVPRGTPVEHVHTAVAAARQFGVYPIIPDLHTQTFLPPECIPFEEWWRRDGLPV